MAMTLRLDEQETEALRRRAELEGRSMQDVARQAVRDYIEQPSKRGTRSRRSRLQQADVANLDVP